jgi:hypothetical protein
VRHEIILDFKRKLLFILLEIDHRGKEGRGTPRASPRSKILGLRRVRVV